MTLQIALLLFVIVAALVLFSLERFPSDVVALGVLAILVVAGLLPPAQAFAGFSSDAAIMIFGLLVFAAAWVRTGVVDLIGKAIFRLAGDRPARLLALIATAAATGIII